MSRAPDTAGTGNRRDLIAFSLRVATVLAGASAVSAMTGCRRPEQPPAGFAPVVPPHLPEGSPDFDVLNTLLQLEYRAAALASAVLEGERLDPSKHDLVSAVTSHHRTRADQIAALIIQAGGTPGRPREEYVLPTPLGDQRRAIGTLVDAEGVLAGAYQSAYGQLVTPTLLFRLGAAFFGESADLAALAGQAGSATRGGESSVADPDAPAAGVKAFA